MCYPLPTSYHDWNGYEVKEPAEWYHLDVTSRPCFLECVQFVCVCTLKRLCAFCYAHFCHIKYFSYKKIHEEYFPTKKRQLHRREREAWVHIYFRTYRSARMVLYIKHVLFILIDRSVCIIQNNHFLDVLIKYIANYHISYSGQLEIRWSVSYAFWNVVIWHQHTL